MADQPPNVVAPNVDQPSVLAARGVEDLRALWQQQPTDDLVRLDPGRAPTDALALADPMVRPPARWPWLVPFVVLATLLLLGAGRVVVPVHLVGLCVFVAYTVFLGTRRALPASALVGAAVAMTAILSTGSSYVARQGRVLRPERPEPFDAAALARCLANTHAEAEEACGRVLALAPSHPAASTRMALITMCNGLRARADALSRAGDATGALSTLELISDACAPQFVAATKDIEPLSREAERRCAQLASDGRWEEARPACEAAARVRCQAGDEFSSTEPTLGLGLSWPQVKAGLGSFVCPDSQLLRMGAKPRPRARRVLEVESPSFARALDLYSKGELVAARDAVSREPGSATLVQQLDEAINLERAWNDAVMFGNTDAQLSATRQLLALEARALPAGTTSVLSERLASRAARELYNRGKAYADKRDARRACVTWKEGQRLARSDVDLLKALANYCTPRAQTALARAPSCPALYGVFDLAVDGDGVREQLERRLDELHCRDP